MGEFDNIGMVTYDEEVIASLTSISKKEPEIVPEEPEPVEPETSIKITEESNLFDNYHNFYINFFNYMKQFLKYTVVGGFDSRKNDKTLLRIKHFVFNYGSKTISSSTIQGQESVEYPICTININDIRPVDSVKNISRQLLKDSFQSPNDNMFIAENEDKKEVIIASVAQNLMSVSASIEFEDSTDIINYTNNLFNQIPLNFTVYTPPYSNYINVTDMVSNWDQDDDSNGLIIKPSNTYLNKDFVFAEIVNKPTLELSSATQNVDKEGQNYILNLEMIWNMFQPIGITKNRFYTFDKIEVDINTSTNAGLIDNELPLLTQTSIDSDILNDPDIVSKNIKSYIQLSNQNFLTKGEIIFYSDVDIDTFSFWSKLNPGLNKEVTKTSRKEYYYPLDYLNKEKYISIIEINKGVIKEDDNYINIDSSILEIVNDKLTDSLNEFIKIVIYDNLDITKYCYVVKSKYILADAGNLYNYNSKILLF